MNERTFLFGFLVFAVIVDIAVGAVSIVCFIFVNGIEYALITARPLLPLKRQKITLWSNFWGRNNNIHKILFGKHKKCHLCIVFVRAKSFGLYLKLIRTSQLPL